MHRAVEQLAADALLGPIVQKVGPKHIEQTNHFYARFVRSILRQQVSMASADAVYLRLESHVNLSPSIVAHSDIETIRACGVSQQKAGTIIAVATAFIERGWSLEYFEAWSDQEIINELTTIKGVGIWTAKMQLIFSFARPDVFPIEDLGIRRGMDQIAESNGDRESMRTIAERWRPYRSIAAIYLWEITD